MRQVSWKKPFSKEVASPARPEIAPPTVMPRTPGSTCEREQGHSWLRECV